MKKSQKKIANIHDLRLTWCREKTDAKAIREESVSGPRRVEDYLDFLEDIAPATTEDRPVKVYGERFTL